MQLLRGSNEATFSLGRPNMRTKLGVTSDIPSLLTHASSITPSDAATAVTLGSCIEPVL